MRRDAAYVAWFEALGKTDIDLAGGKGANLGEMAGAGLPIPPGFVVTSHAYQRFLEENRMRGELARFQKETRTGNQKHLDAQSERIRKFITKARVPQAISDCIVDSYKRLSDYKSPGVFVAVRSSATAEDLASASFAGQQDTYLNVCAEDLVSCVQKCWASLYTSRAIFYRERQGFDQAIVSMAVVVQKMITAEKAGVMFTVNPVTRETDRIIIEAVWGLGEGAVSGTITPDHYVMDKNTGRLETAVVARKQTMFTRDEATGKTVETSVPPEKVDVQILTEQEMGSLVDLGMKVERHYALPQDIEWAIEGNNVYLLQSRPVTGQK